MPSNGQPAGAVAVHIRDVDSSELALSKDLPCLLPGRKN